MRVRIFQVDAFTARRFAGNPAAVCPLSAWPDDDLMQAVAAENNLSETAFLVPEDGEFGLRWFTPEVEVELCGHATLAAGYVVLRLLEPERESVVFRTRSGPLEVWRDEERLAMDFPSVPPEACDPPPGLAEGLGRRPQEVLAADDYLAVFREAAEVAHLEPDFGTLAGLDRRGVIATAPGDATAGDDGTTGESADVPPDFVSRFFAPKLGVPEDPVTGSAHCTLAPYWAERLGRTRLEARQISPRGGEVRCEVRGDRVVLAGHAVLYLEGTIRV